MNSPPNPTPAEVEREKIVAWLRESGPCFWNQRRWWMIWDYPARRAATAAFKVAADWIERGAHIAKEGE